MTNKENLLKSKIKIQKSIIICLILAVCSIFGMQMYIIYGNNMRPKMYNNIYLEYADVEYYNFNEATEQVKQLFNTPHIYIEQGIQEYGRAIPIYRIVIINKSLKQNNQNEYLRTYAHELTHIKYATINETYTTYKSITILYESGIPYLQAIAWNEAVSIMRGYRSGEEYDCGYYLREYFGV